MLRRLNYMMWMSGLACLAIAGCAPEDHGQDGDKASCVSGSVCPKETSYSFGLEQEWGEPLKSDSPAWMEGDPVRLALVDVSGSLPQGNLQSLLGNVELESLENEGEHKLSSKVRKGMLIALEAQDLSWGQGESRTWKYRVKADLPPVQFPGGFKIPFKINAESVVELSRVFTSEMAANSAEPLTIKHLPHDVESALKLPEGSVVTVPIDAKFTTDVTGAFLTRSCAISKELNEHLKTSAMGTLSGIRQGTLVGDGLYQLQFIRLPGEKVRVRVFTGSDVQGNMGLTVTGTEGISYAFLPVSFIDRALEIRKRVEKLGKLVTERKPVGERVSDFMDGLSGQLRLIFEHVSPGALDEEHWVRQLAKQAKDGATSVLAQGSVTFKQLESHIRSRVEKMLEVTVIPWKDKIEPALNVVKNLSSRVFTLSGAINLSHQFARRVRTLGDYTFDLSDPVAQRAFERVISGRTAFIGAFKGIANSNVEDALYGDLTLAESIATEDEGVEFPRVQRETLAFGDMNENSHRAYLGGLWLSSGTALVTKSNHFVVENESGEVQEWDGHAWELDKEMSWWTGKAKEVFASGAFVDAVEGEDTQSSYWMTWRREYAKNAASPVQRSLAETLNLLGPVALEAGLASLYEGEHPGKVKTALDVVVSAQGLNLLFDEELTDDALMWAVFGTVAESFDNSFGFPYIANPIRPEGLSEIPGAELACEVIAYRLGGYYCSFFANDFLPALRGVQSGMSPESRASFLASYYEKGGWFGNPIGSRLLTRFLTTLLYALGAEDEVTMKLEVRNEGDASEAASPSLVYGNPEELLKVRVMTPEGIR